MSDIRRKIRRGGIKLPEVPTIVVKLNEMMHGLHASSHDVAQIVGSSPSLSAILFRIVNSAAFGLPTKVDSIVRAVSLLGTRQISSLAIGLSVMQAFGTIPGNVIDMPAFIIHSLSCATMARIIAALANMKNTEINFKGRIFEPFFSTKFVGRGLSMAAVLGIVENHHGAIFVDSVAGRETIVTIYLPLE